MSQLDDFGVDNPNEDHIDGAEEYIAEVWEQDEGIQNPADHEDSVEGIDTEVNVHELSKKADLIEPEDLEEA